MHSGGDSALQSKSGGKAWLLLHLHQLGRRLGPLSHLQWPLKRCSASAEGRRGVCLHTALVGRVLGQHELRPTHCSERASPRQPSQTPQAALRSSVRPSTVSPPHHDMGMVGSCSLATPSSNSWAKPGQRSHGQGRCCGSCLSVAACFCRAGAPSLPPAAQTVQPHETHPRHWRLWRDPPARPPTGELRLVPRC